MGETAKDADSSAQTAEVPQIFRLVGSVVAPTTLLTGLLVNFGQTYAESYCQYFCVNFTALNMSAQDYLVRSVDGVFVPLTILATIALLAFGANRVVGQIVELGDAEPPC